MSYQDPIAAALTHIRNAQMRGLDCARVPRSKLMYEVLRVMKEEGFIESFADEGSYHINVELRYLRQGLQGRQPVIDKIARVSKSSRRQYVGYKDLHNMTAPSFGIYILTTPQGVMSHHQAKAQKVGGEVICCVA